MRLLDEIQQEHIWTSLYEGLPVYETMGKKAIPFPIVQENLGSISGHSEAFYAVLSSNYIEGSIDSNLKYASVCIYMQNSCIDVLKGKRLLLLQSCRGKDYGGSDGYGRKLHSASLLQREVFSISSIRIDDRMSKYVHKIHVF
jgi:hypothetical protein